MVNSDDDVDGDGDDDDQEEKDDEESSLRMIILVSSSRRENNIYGRLRGVLLPHLPLELLQIVTKMYHIFIQRLSLKAHFVTKMYHIYMTYIDISQKISLSAGNAND